MSGVALPSASAGSAAVGRPDDPPAVAPWIASASASLSTRDDARSDDRAILLGASPDVDADEASFLDSYFAFTSAHFGIDRAEVRARLVGLGAEWRAGVHAGYRGVGVGGAGPTRGAGP